MQDQAGAPLTAADPTPSTPAPVPTGGRRRLYAVLLGLAAATLVLDQGTKAWALASLTPGEAVDLVGSALRLNLIRNPGAAFSLGDGSTWILTVISVTILVFVGASARKVGNLPWESPSGCSSAARWETWSTVSSARRAPVEGTSSTSSTTWAVRGQCRGHRDRHGRGSHHGAHLPGHLARRAGAPPRACRWVTPARCSFPTGSRVSASTRPSPGSSASRAPAPPTSPPPAG